jgi:hypothetical protein
VAGDSVTNSRLLELERRHAAARSISGTGDLGGLMSEVEEKHNSDVLHFIFRPFFFISWFTGIFWQNLMSEGGKQINKKDSYSFF